MIKFNVTLVSAEEPNYPGNLLNRFGEKRPRSLSLIGSVDLLKGPLLALICSVRCPGNEILKAYETAKKVARSQWIVISGFHSPMEKECLRILLRAKRPVIICPARSLEGMRISTEWREPIAAGRMLLLSPFTNLHRRSTTRMAVTRNLLVAAIADTVWIPYINKGSKTEALTSIITSWGGMIRDTENVAASTQKQ